MPSNRGLLLLIILLLSLLVFAGCVGIFGPNLKPGQDLFEKGDYQGSLEYYQTLITANQTNAKLYRLAYASAFLSGQRITAGKYYQAALEAGFAADSLQNLAVELWYDRALRVMGQNAWQAARKAADQLSRLAPGSPQDKFCQYILKGKQKFDRGAHKGLWDAVSDYHQAANYNPTSGLPYFLMGQARYKNNRTDYDAALEDYHAALKIEPDGAFAKQARQDIKKIEAVKQKMNAFWGK